MDKMKLLTKWLRKYHFWVLLVVVVILGTAGWCLAAGKLTRKFKDNEGAINNAFSKASTIRGTQRHPNDEYLENTGKLIQATRTSVWEAWLKKYKKQGDLFVWPEELGSDFLNVVKDLRPFETKVPYPLEDELLRIDLRESYPEYIRSELPQLAARIGAEWKAREATGDVRPGGPAMPRSERGDEGEREGNAGTAETSFNEMRWNAVNQQEIYNNHFDWSNQPDRAPTTLQVLYAQEDLWVFRSLMEILRKTNGGTKSARGLAIPYVDFIRIGKSQVDAGASQWRWR